IDIGNGRRPRVSAMKASTFSASLDHGVRTQQISVQEVWETRRLLGTETSALAAVRRTAEEAHRIRRLAESMRRAAPAAAEPMLETAIPTAWSVVDSAEHYAEILARHQALAEMIRRRDPDGARQAMDDHFDRSVAARLPTS